MRFVATLLLLLFVSPALAAYPYDSVGNVSAGGSGTLVYAKDGKGLIITCAHVVMTVSETTVTWPTAPNQKRKCKTVFVDNENDIALLVCDNPPVKPTPHRKHSGNFFVSAGFPYYDRAHLHWQASLGIKVDGDTLMVTHKPVPGMSGGAAFDCYGYLVGVVRFHNQNDGGIAAGKSFLEALEKYRGSQTWKPNADHVVNPPDDVNFAPQDGHVRTIKYIVDTAPELPWPKSEYSIFDALKEVYESIVE